MPQTPSTRWCPTPEQLMILEEMYRSGVRTPNAAEIQQITAHLAYYGRIEGKNVFYWFQNHKARERQRLRRRLCARHQQQYAQQQAAAAAAPAAAALAAAGAPPLPTPPHAAAGGSGVASSAAGVHPAVLQLQLHHHHHPYAASFMPLPQGGYFQQDAAAAAPGMEFAGCKLGTAGGGGSNQLQLQLQEEDWTAAGQMECSGSSCCGRQPLKTLELFPTKSTGLRDECCSSSKSSSCSTSTN